MHSLSSDLRYAMRELRRRPGFAITAVLSLALGIAATSAVYSVIYAVLIDPFPYASANRLVQITLKDKSDRNRYPGLNGRQMEQIRQTRSIENAVAEDGWNLTTTDGDLPEDVQASYVSTNAPNQWGVPALKGRWFIPSDAPPGRDPERVIVLGYRFWQRYYGGDPNVVGRNIELVKKRYQIVGVMPRRFRWREADIYVPLKVTLEPNIYYGALLKLRSGVSVDQANAELQPIFERFGKETPDRYPDNFRVNVRSIIDLYAKPMQAKLYLLFGAVASLLLIGCANVSILLLARGAQRQHELAVRAAMGAGRSRIIRQLLTEALVIAIAGAMLGVLFAWKSLALLIAWIPENSYPAESIIQMNFPVLLFSMGVAVATAIVCGISPALQLSRPDLGRVIQTNMRRIMGSASGKRTHSVLVGVQVALTLLMLAAAGAAAKGFMRIVNADLGYDPHQTMSVPIPVHENTYQTWKERSAYFEQIRGTIAAMPQVAAAGISTNATPPLNGNDNRIEIAGRTQLEKPVVRMNFVNSDYFPVLHIPLSQGRIWNQTETVAGARLAVINQTMARQYWPNRDPIGKQFRIVGLKNEPPYSPAAEGSEGWLQIVGVVRDARNDGLRNAIKPAVYVPYSLKMRMFTQILVRTRVAPLSLLRDIRTKIVGIDRNQQVMRVRDLDQWITGLPEYGQQRFVATLFAIFSMLALALGGIGLYSVVSYGVATRTNEFGIRMALGAKARNVVTIVVSTVLVNVGIGLLAGLLLSVIFDSVAAKWVTESSRDPLLLVAVTILLIAIAGLACMIPARRAALVDPMVALRYE